MDPKFMSVKEAASQLVKIVERNPDSGVDSYHTYYNLILSNLLF